MLKLFLWLKYIKRARIVLLGVAAVAVSAALMIVVASLFSGFISKVERHASQSIGDITISPPFEQPIEDYPALIRLLEEIPSIEAAAPVMTSVGLVHLGGGNVRQVAIIGIDPPLEAGVTDMRDIVHGPDGRRLADFRPASEERAIPAWIGIGALMDPDPDTDRYDREAARAVIGSRVVLITGSVLKEVADGRPSLRQRTLRLEVQGVLHSGNRFADAQLYMPINELKGLLFPGREGAIAQSVKIRLAAKADIDKSLESVRQVWSGFAGEGSFSPETDVRSALDMTVYQTYLAELYKQMSVLIIIFGVISSVGVLLIFCIFYMMVIAKRRDIGIMKSCGTSPAGVAGIFLGFAAWVGLIGSGCGVVLGWLFISNINAIEGFLSRLLGWKMWRSSAYIFDVIPNELDATAVAWVIPAAVLASLLGVLVPAIVAARMNTVDILRYE